MLTAASTAVDAIQTTTTHACTLLLLLLLLQGLFIHLAPAAPSTTCDSCPEKPWWKDRSYRVRGLNPCFAYHHSEHNATLLGKSTRMVHHRIQEGTTQPVSHRTPDLSDAMPCAVIPSHAMASRPASAPATPLCVTLTVASAAAALSYQVGSLTHNLRNVRVKNTLTGQEDTMEVPGEETVGEIQARYLALNAHASSYTWKALTRGVQGESVMTHEGYMCSLPTHLNSEQAAIPLPRPLLSWPAPTGKGPPGQAPPASMPVASQPPQEKSHCVFLFFAYHVK
jgi:hypothetical protein